MSEQAETTEPRCAVCGRNLLLGERTSAYVSREGLEVRVCDLCKSRAESAGWLRPEDAAAGGAEGGRPRRRGRGELLSNLLPRGERTRGRRGSARAEERDLGRNTGPDRVGEGAGGTPEPPGADRGRRRKRPRSAPDPSREQDGSAPARDSRSAAGPDINQAIAAFNGSENRRTIAGLSRSLGDPRATAIAIRTAGGHNGARLTVAWELAWYQWEIGPGRRGPEIRQTAKGETVDQLRAADRNWNLRMAEDGTLSRPPRTEP